MGSCEEKEGSVRRTCGSMNWQFCQSIVLDAIGNELLWGFSQMQFSKAVIYTNFQASDCAQQQFITCESRNISLASMDRCNGQVKPDTFLDSFLIEIPFKLQRGLIT